MDRNHELPVSIAAVMGFSLPFPIADAIELPTAGFPVPTSCLNPHPEISIGDALLHAPKSVNIMYAGTHMGYGFVNADYLVQVGEITYFERSCREIEQRCPADSSSL